jgi:hypothetical protein
VVTQGDAAEGGLYIEGAIAYLEVADQDGEVIEDLDEPDYLGEKELTRIDVPAGRYVVRMFVRPCAGNCGELDPPTDHCETTVDVPADSVVEVHIARRVGDPCEISS